MRPLPLAVFLIWGAPFAAAQTRAGSVSEAAVPGQSGNLNPVLGAGGAPQPLVFSAASLSAGLTPSLVPAAIAPTPGLAAAPYAAAALPAPLIPTVIKPARILPLSEQSGRAPEIMTPIRRALSELAPDGVDKLDEAGLLLLTKALYGEGAAAAPELPGKGAYLRPDRPLSFGASELEAYEKALDGKRGGEKEQRALIEASRLLLASAGVETVLVERAVSGFPPYPALEIVPIRRGSELNKLAWNLKNRHGTALEYAPARLAGPGAVASFNHAEKTMFLPHFGKSGTFAAVLHESHHSRYAARQERGDLSPFHVAAVAKKGRIVVPGAQYYGEYVSLEELTGHAKTIKHLVAAARRNPPKSWWTNYEIDVEALKLQDLSRTAWHLAGRVLTELKNGAEVERVPDGDWSLEQLGPIKGGAWHRLILPWCTVYIPVLDEPPPPPKRGLAKLFSRRAETPGGRAARKSTEAIRIWALETGDALASLRSALAADAESWEKINALADELTSAGPRAEKIFKSAP